MAERTEWLRSVFTCQEGMRRITCPSMNSRIQVFSADEERTGDGVIFTLALLDELHRHRDMKLYRTWRGKVGKRTGAQLVVISTAGEPGSEFEETRKLMRSTRVVEGRPGYTNVVL
ncbi:MAG: terminase large subunit domain-containing protein [Gaiellaceae bacterium]